MVENFSKENCRKRKCSRALCVTASASKSSVSVVQTMDNTGETGNQCKQDHPANSVIKQRSEKHTRNAGYHHNDDGNNGLEHIRPSFCNQNIRQDKYRDNRERSKEQHYFRIAMEKSYLIQQE